MLIFILFFTLYSIIFSFSIFLFAKKFGVRVEQFYVWYAPKFPLLKVKRGETEYQLGWLPLGSSVKMSGMVTEPNEELLPYYFNYASLFQRVLIIISGPVACFSLGIGSFIYFKELALSEVTNTLLYLTLILVAYLLVIKLISSSASKRMIKTENQYAFHFLHFIVALITYGAFIFSFLFFVEQLMPIYSTAMELISGNFKIHHFPNSFSSDTAKSLFSFTGIYLFLINLLPLGGLNGFTIFDAIYKAISGYSFPQRAFENYLIISTMLVYVFYFWIIISLFL